MRLAVRVDQRLRERQRERTSRPIRPSPVFPNRREIQPEVPEPMELGGVRTPRSPDRHRRLREGLCFSCGGRGHQYRHCPSRPRQGKATTFLQFKGEPGRAPYLMLPISLRWGGQSIRVEALLDSGASLSLMDSQWARQKGIPCMDKAIPTPLRVLDGTPLAASPITQVTSPIVCCMGEEFVEEKVFDITVIPAYPIILGIDWLTRHNPEVNWQTRVVRPRDSESAKIMVVPSPGNMVGHAEVGSLPPCYSEFSDVFDEVEAEALPPHRSYDCPIELLPGAALPVGHVYPLSEPELSTLREYLDVNLKKGFIRPSTSPVGAGIFFVKKKDGTLRPVVDYRGLNKITIKNKYPLPLIPQLMDQLKGAQVFTKLDLRGAYNLIRIRKDDEWKTAFRTRYGLYECLVMPFGLCNAPATFQSFINDVFRDLLDVCVIVYLDDILIYSPGIREHQDHVRRVLTRLRTHRLFAKLEKCEFHQKTVPFLGFVISPDRILMDNSKIKAVQEWPVPNTRRRLQAFLGFANYYRKFIPQFSQIVAPLTKLTSTKERYLWTPQAQGAFEVLKGRFTTAPILRMPDPDRAFVLEVDASEVALGAVLSQREDATRPLHPVAYLSRTLTAAERNYPVGERELLAIRVALEHWRHYLEGAKYPIQIYTDHKNLQYLQTSKTLTSRQVRWSLFFNRFIFSITYKPGSRNGKADALSRICEEEVQEDPPQTMFPEGTVIGVADSDAPTTSNPVTPGRRLVPPEERTEVLKTIHDLPLAGHPGIRRTQELLRRHYFWPGDRRDVERYIASCTTCCRNKTRRALALGLLQPLPIPKGPWKAISMDFVVELPPSGGNTTILVVVDRFTKMAHFIPFHKLPTAIETARLFLHHIVRLHGLPEEIVTDRGTQFTAKFWAALCKTLGVKHDLSSAFHPQTNGQTERVNQSMEQYLRCYATHLQDNWAEILPMAEFAYNNATNASSKMSPFYAHSGYHPRSIPETVEVTDVPALDEFAKRTIEHCRIIRHNLEDAQEGHKRFADAHRRAGPAYVVGDLVWLSTKNIRLRIPTKKLGPLFIGPYKVTAVINDVTFRLALPASFQLHPVFHTSLLKRHTEDEFPGRRNPPAPPVEVDGEEEYEVSEILDSRWRYRKLQYLVRWKGYGPEDDSWIEATDLHASRLVSAFHRQHPGKPGPSRPQSGRV